MKRTAAILAIIIIGGIVIYNFDPTQYRFMPKCFFKLFTGFSCPACGIQRAIYSLLHGDFVKAIHYNYYLLYSGPYAASFIVVWAMPRNNLRSKIRKCIENKYVVDFYVITFITWLFVRNLLNI